MFKKSKNVYLWLQNLNNGESGLNLWVYFVDLLNANIMQKIYNFSEKCLEYMCVVMNKLVIKMAMFFRIQSSINQVSSVQSSRGRNNYC